MNTNTNTRPVCVRTCSCGTKFVPPAIAPKAERCRKCHVALRRKQAETAKKVEAGRKAEAEIRAMLKDMFVKNELPKHAKVTRSGSQVAIAWGGMSATFHMAA